MNFQSTLKYFSNDKQYMDSQLTNTSFLEIQIVINYFTILMRKVYKYNEHAVRIVFCYQYISSVWISSGLLLFSEMSEIKIIMSCTFHLFLRKIVIY